MIDLKSILQQYPNCLNSRASFKSVLMDKYPSEKRTVNILTILFECGIANRIKARKSIDANEMYRLIAQVENEYGISGQYAQDSIMIWAAAFDVTVSAVKVNTTGAAAQQPSKPVVNKPVVYVQGNVDDYRVAQRQDGYYIKRFNGFEEEEMTIPSMIDGKRIKGIAGGAFNGCITVKKIHISEGIEVIEDGAFMECEALEDVTLPDTLWRIGTATTHFCDGAFERTRLKVITIPQNVKVLGPSSFSMCNHLRKVELPDQITAIRNNTFHGCRNLTEIKSPGSLESIGNGAFYGCSSLTEIKLPSSMETIDDFAFHGCSSLTEIKLPDNLESIGNGAFYDCGSLTEIKLPNRLKSIGYSAFHNCSSLIEIKLPSSLVTIGDFAFAGCPRMTIYCAAGSVAMEYARKHNIKCAKAQF